MHVWQISSSLEPSWAWEMMELGARHFILLAAELTKEMEQGRAVHMNNTMAGHNSYYFNSELATIFYHLLVSLANSLTENLTIRQVLSKVYGLYEKQNRASTWPLATQIYLVLINLKAIAIKRISGLRP